MQKQTIRDADVDGKRVLVRVDFNVPIENGVISDDTRIRASLPTINNLLDRNSAVILMSHLGRPRGKPADELRLHPIADRLARLLDRPVKTAAEVVGSAVREAADSLQPGELLLLENVRFESGEENNDPSLAWELASLAEIYVNDAFGSAHRAHASTVGVAEYLPAYAGLLMEAEIRALGSLLDQPDRPFVAILGGAKVSDKVGVIANLIDRVDIILVGGGMANTFLSAVGHEVGSSLAERDFGQRARDLLMSARERGVTFLLPDDVVAAKSMESKEEVIDVDSVLADHSIFDIGPRTVEHFATEISRAQTVFWNGPMGVFERDQFASGTRGIAEAVAANPGFTVIGGGDSVAAIEQAGLADRISHISTGGGASLEYIEGKELPGVAALLDAKEQAD
ncbi:MAG: phosphoglycerate kinase [Thermomicrobiales bacterium]